jgi:hypothetical protein
VTYIWTQEGWLYLYVVIDLCFQKVDGWSMSSHMKVQLLCDALQMVIWQRRPDARFSSPFRQRVTICHQGIYTVANTTRHLKVVWVARAAVGMPCERYTAGYWYLDLGGCIDCFWRAFKAIYRGDQHVLHTAVFQIN